MPHESGPSRRVTWPKVSVAIRIPMLTLRHPGPEPLWRSEFVGRAFSSGKPALTTAATASCTSPTPTPPVCAQAFISINQQQPDRLHSIVVRLGPPAATAAAVAPCWGNGLQPSVVHFRTRTFLVVLLRCQQFHTIRMFERQRGGELTGETAKKSQKQDVGAGGQQQSESTSSGASQLLRSLSGFMKQYLQSACRLS